jgi:protein arginine N-methyltransferase 2
LASLVGCHNICRYGEYYEEMREFHQQLPQLLRPGGAYSYFNGLASDNFFFHMVYGR